jgi:hypothetical protein
MNKYRDQIMAVLFLGSVWGAFEIFGFRWLTWLGVPHRSPFLFAFAILTMVAAKRVAPFPGSALIMAVIAGFYKVLTLSLPACGSNAVMALLLDAAAFESVHALMKNNLEAGLLKRALMAVMITFLAYSAFAIYAAYVNPEGTAASRSFDGVLSYLRSSGILAAVLTIFTFNLGLAFGNSIRTILTLPVYRKLAGVSKVTAGVVIIWVWASRLG